MLKKLSRMGLCLGVLAVVSVPLAPTTAHAQELTNEELLGNSVEGLNLAQARAEFERGWNALLEAGDWANALQIFRPLAEQGYGPAQYQMGSAYERGLGGLARDYATADEWWEKAAQTLPQQAEAHSTVWGICITLAGAV